MPTRLCSPRGADCRCHRCPLCDDRLLIQLNDPQTIRPLRLRWSSNELSEPNLWRLRSNLTNFVTWRLCHLRSLTKSSWPSDGGWPMLDTINTVRTILKNSRNPAKAVYDDHDLCVYDREMLDSVEGAHPAKLDLILTRRKKLGPKERVRWRDVGDPFWDSLSGWTRVWNSRCNVQCNVHTIRIIINDARSLFPPSEWPRISRG